MSLLRYICTASKASSCKSKILSIVGREIIDSRGNPTVEVDVVTPNGKSRASVPSGASTGIYEALELRDKDPKRFVGKGVLKAVENISKIIQPALLNIDVTEQRKIDEVMVQKLDGTQNEWGYCKSKLGANSILGVSLACARAGAQAENLPLYEYIAKLAERKTNKFLLPVPALNIINGGAHAGNKLAFQEFMIMPTGAKSFREAMRMACEVYRNLQTLLKKTFDDSAINVGDEGGFGTPHLNNEDEALEILNKAIATSGYKGAVKIAADVAASDFYDEKVKKYNLGKKIKNSNKFVSGDEMINLYGKIIQKNPIVSIEDPFDQDDFESYKKFTKQFGEKIQIVGDDLLVTNSKRIQMAIKDQLVNSLLLKVNQIGSLTESIDSCKLAYSAGWSVMVSHRSGETEDPFIADLVVGLGTGIIKTGAPCRSERLSKYNQLIRIEEELGSKAVYAGDHFRTKFKEF